MVSAHKQDKLEALSNSGLSDLVSQIELAESELDLNFTRSEIVNKKYDLLEGNSFDAYESEQIRLYKKMLETLDQKLNQIPHNKANKRLKQIQSIEAQEKSLTDSFLRNLEAHNPETADTLKRQMATLNTLLSKIENTRSRFRSVRKVSNLYYRSSTFFSFVSIGATFAEIVPMASLIAHPIRIGSDFLRTAALNAAYERDPSVPQQEKQAVKENLAAVKKLNVAETSIAIAGTAVLGASFVVPVLLPIGAALLCASNIVSIAATSKELETAKFLNTLPGFHKDPGHQIRIQSLEERLSGKKANAFGSGFAVLAAVAVVLTIAFPPAGLAFTVLAGIALGITALCSIYAAKKAINEKNLRNEAEIVTRTNSEQELKDGDKLKFLEQKLAEKKQHLELGSHIEELKQESDVLAIKPKYLTNAKKSNSLVVPSYDKRKGKISLKPPVPSDPSPPKDHEKPN